MKVINYTYIFLCIGMFPFATIAYGENTILSFISIVVIPYFYYFLFWKPLLDFEYKVKNKKTTNNNYRYLIKNSVQVYVFSIFVICVYFYIYFNLMYNPLIFLVAILPVIILISVTLKKILCSIFYKIKEMKSNETNNL